MSRKSQADHKWTITDKEKNVNEMNIYYNKKKSGKMLHKTSVIFDKVFDKMNTLMSGLIE